MENSMNIELPFEFVYRSIPLTWTDIKVGIDNHFLLSDDAITYAVEILDLDVPHSSDLRELAFRFKGEDVEPYLSNLCNAEHVSKDSSEEKWLFLILKWIFKNRNNINDDPLELVEIIYADFDYPSIISNIVRYTSCDDISIPFTGDAALYYNWERYLKQQELLFQEENIE